MLLKRPRKAGVSTLVASLFILMIIAMSFIYMAYMISQLGSLANEVVEVANEAVLKSKVKLNVVNTYVNATGLIIEVSNNGTATAVINAYSVRDLSTGKSIYGTFSKPYVIPPATTETIVIPGTFSTTTKYLISLGSSYGYVVKGTYPPPPPTTPTAITVPTLATTASGTPATLSTLATQGTATWAGTALIPNYYNVTSNVTAAQVNEVLSTEYVALQNIDNVNITAVGRASYALKLIQNNTIFWTNFRTNPLTNGELKPISGTWVYDPTTHTVAQIDPTRVAAIAYFPEAKISAGSTYYIVSMMYTYYIGQNSGYFIAFPLNTTSLNTYVGGLNINYTIFIIWPFYEYYVNLSKYSPSTFTPVASRLLTSSFPTYVRRWYEVFNKINYGAASLDINTTLIYITDTGAVRYGYVTATVSTLGNYGYVGFLTSVSEANFTRVLVTVNATPYYVNITNVPPGWNVTLLSNGVQVASAVNVGTTVSNVSLYLLQKYLDAYIVEDPEFLVYNSTGGLVLDYRPPFTVLGGMVFNLSKVYTVNVTSYVSTSTSIPVTSAYICTALTPNASSTVIIQAYDFSTSSFTALTELPITNSLLKCFKLSSVSDYINSSGYSIFSVIAYSTSPLNVSIDLLNAKVTTYNFTPVDALVVGVGGSDRIDAYRLSTAGTNVYLSYLGSMSSNSLFDGSTDIVFDSVVTKSLIMVNGSGVYNTSLLTGEPWHLISTACRALGRGVRAELVGNYLLVLEGGGTPYYCLLNLQTGTAVDGSVGTYLSCGDYCVSASNGTVAYALLLYNNSLVATPQIWGYSPTKGWFFVGNFTGYKSVGMVYGPEVLYVMLEYGALYSIDPSSGSFSRLGVALIFYPIGFGDRLEYYGGKLIFVRGSSTNEIWLVTP